MILYEYPFHEGIRTMLRLEQLFSRLDLLAARESAVDHHFALVTLFEVMDVAARADLKSDLLKELDRQRMQLQSYRGHPNVAVDSLEGVIARIDQDHAALNQLQGKAGQALANHDWLMSIRSRISIPGGTCSFDLPAYCAWQHLDARRRQEDLHGWLATLAPLSAALRLLLALMRDSGPWQRMVAPAGQYQQSLANSRSYQLLRVQVDPAAGLVPEITGHRLMVSIRFMRCEPDGRTRPLVGSDAVFDLALCA